ncbi:MAG: hypothetical protein CM1200mP36_07210 [Gammaproteobacteria bacterium]|nr:MAG: hypothetical protein CM1200mP36_07210 [Gammaproteobacteria bacterium]
MEPDCRGASTRPRAWQGGLYFEGRLAEGQPRGPELRHDVLDGIRKFRRRFSKNFWSPPWGFGDLLVGRAC